MSNRIVARALELRRKYGGSGHTSRSLAETPVKAPSPSASSPRIGTQPVRVRVPKPWPKVTHADAATQWAAWITALVDWREKSDDRVEQVIGRLGEPWVTMLAERRTPSQSQWADLLVGVGLGQRPLPRAGIAHWDELLRKHGLTLALVPDGIDGQDQLDGILVVGLVGDGTAKGTTVEWLHPLSGELRTTAFAEFDRAFAVPGPDEEGREVLLWPMGERLAKEPVAMALRVRPSFAGALGYEPGDSGNPAKLEWKNLTLTTGGDGKKHLYYLASGGPYAKARFDVAVTNKNAKYNLMSQKVSVSLVAVGDAKSKKAERVVPLDGQAAGDKYLSWKRKGELEDETTETITFHVDRKALQQAFDPDHPLTRIDLEYRFVEYGVLKNENGYQTTSLGFFLVESANLMWSKRKYLGEVSLEDPKYSEHWIGLVQRRFGKDDKAPIDVEGTLQYTVSASKSATVGHTLRLSNTTTEKDGTEWGIGVGGKMSSGSSGGISLEKILELGVTRGNELSGSFNYKSVSELTKSRTKEVIESVSSSTQFAQTIGRTLRISTKLEPGAPGVLRKLHAYPVYKLYVMPVVFYEANDHGQAKSRSVIDDFPVLVPDHLGFRADPSETTPPPPPPSRPKKR